MEASKSSSLTPTMMLSSLEPWSIILMLMLLCARLAKILAAVPKGAYKIAMCSEGVQFDSVSLAGKISEAIDTSGKIALIIGSSHGLSDKVKENCKLKLSISKLTFPHQLMRAMLFEILYRSFTIIAGKRYHK